MNPPRIERIERIVTVTVTVTVRRLLWPPAKISQLYYLSCVYVLLRILDAMA